MTVLLALGVTLGFAAAVQPGPFTAFVVAQTLAGGWRRAWPTAFAPPLSDAPIAAVVLTVLAAVPAGALNALRLAGGAVILWLAWGAFRTWRRYDAAAAATPGAAAWGLAKAVSVNIVNPGAWLGWSVVIGPLVLRAWREAPLRGAALLAAFYGTMILTYLAIILVFHAARGLGPRVSRALIGVSAAALAGFGVYQIWMGVRGA